MHKPTAWLGTLVASVALPAAAQDPAPGWRHGPGMMGDGGWAWMMFFGVLVMILFVAAVVVLVAFALRWLGGHGPHAAGHPPTPLGKAPIDILKERFARGEIDQAEFEERRRVLGEQEPRRALRLGHADRARDGLNPENSRIRRKDAAGRRMA